MSIVYGIGVESPDDRFLSASLDAAHALAVMLIPGKFLADVIPIRVCLCVQTVIYKHLTDLLIVRHVPDRFPGTGFKTLAKETRDKFIISVDGPLEYVKNSMKVRPQSSPRSDRVLNPNVPTTLVWRGGFSVHSIRLFVSFSEEDRERAGFDEKVVRDVSGVVFTGEFVPKFLTPIPGFLNIEFSCN